MIEQVPHRGDYGVPAVPDWRAVDWLAHVRNTTIAGRRVRYVDIGEGPVGFVLVHGMGGCWQHWSQTLPFLAGHGRALALDLPGFGRSQMPADRITVELLADTVAALVGGAGLERVVVMGHSLGGPVALRLADRHPRLVRAVILVAGAVYSFSGLAGMRGVAGGARERPLHTAATLTELLTCGVPVPAPIRRRIAERAALRRVALWPYVHRPGAISPELAALILGGVGAPGVRRTARAIGNCDPFAGLGELDCPLFSIGARHDRIVPVSDLEAFHAATPGSRSVLLEQAGHMLMLERAQVFNEQVGGFLAEIALDRPSAR
jgi:pimeloyl-ACP methyl ester carboxylesterase